MTDDGQQLNILIATDNHLGYCEKDLLRYNDSFAAFEEILQIAVREQVDCIFLAGDLFHENRPSRRTIHRTMELLRHYCMGSKECHLELLSDPSVNFPSKFGTVNYEDPNYNISIPVFTIHGNHDDPTGDGNLSVLDLLSTAGLLNYFGKTTTVDDITMVPVILAKGRTKLCLYGLGSIRDERLHRTFLQRKVKMLRPPQPEQYFNLLLFHQNRSAHGPTNHIPSHFLDDFLDLVVWGHEHECMLDDGPSHCAQRGFNIIQPGSSVATSLSEGETRQKQVLILSLNGRESQVQPIPLYTCRPFVMRDLVLKDQLDPSVGIHDEKAISRFLCGQVKELVQNANEEWKQKNPGSDNIPLPLVRVRVDYSHGGGSNDVGDGHESNLAPTNYSVINPQRFGQQFAQTVANPRDILSILKRTREKRAKKHTLELTKFEQDTDKMKMEDMVSSILGEQSLQIFPQNEFNETVRVAVEKDDRDAIERFVKKSLEKSCELAIDGMDLDLDRLKLAFIKEKREREEEFALYNPPIPTTKKEEDEAPSKENCNKPTKRTTGILSKKAKAPPKHARIEFENKLSQT